VVGHLVAGGNGLRPDAQCPLEDFEFCVITQVVKGERCGAREFSLVETMAFEFEDGSTVKAGIYLSTFVLMEA
jgi:hypothetical protein